MHHLIEPISLSFFTGLTVLALSFCLLFVFRNPRIYAGFSLWVLSSIFLGLAGVLIGLRGLIPDFISIVASNLIGLLGLIAVKRGLGRFYDRPVSIGLDAGLLVFLLCTQMIFLYLHPSLLLRSLFISVAHGLLLLQSAKLADEGNRRLFPEDRLHPVVVVFLTVGVFHALRILVIALCVAYLEESSAGPLLFGASILIMNPGALMMYIGLLSLHARRTTAELVATRTEIKTLTGLLPICCQCKKIRVETSAWQPIETYVREHSSAEFSHGICPECLRELYPDYDQDHPEKPR